MSEQDDRATTRVLRGILAGVVAGAAASFVMDRFQAVATPILYPDAGDSEPSTEKAADAVARVIVGAPVPDHDKPLAGQAVHYAFGVALGVAYGIAAEFEPRVTAGYGTGYGVAVATVADEAVVPALGLGAPPWKADLSTNLFSYVSHVVFGGMLEFVRRQVAGTLVH